MKILQSFFSPKTQTSKQANKQNCNKKRKKSEISDNFFPNTILNFLLKLSKINYRNPLWHIRHLFHYDIATDTFASMSCNLLLWKPVEEIYYLHITIIIHFFHLPLVSQQRVLPWRNLLQFDMLWFILCVLVAREFSYGDHIEIVLCFFS